MAKRAALAIWAALTATLLSPAAHAECKVGLIAELPVTMVGTQPIVHGKINGVDSAFLADSGAFYSMITPSTAAQLKLNLEPTAFNFTIQGVGGDERAYLTKVTFTLADVPIKNLPFLVAAGGGGGHAGILGQNVLGLADVEYDLANGAIRLLQPHDCSHVGLAYWAGDKGFSMMNIEPSEPRSPHTKGVAYVNGARIQVMFDTGASTSVLSLRAAARAGVKPTDAGVVYAGYNQGIGPHVMKTWIAPVASFKVGDEEVRNTQLRIGDLGDVDTDMLLGADFFLSHRVYVSNKQRTLYFTYNGGPVFNLSASAVVQETADQAPMASPVRADGRDEPKTAEEFSRRGAAFDARRDYQAALADLGRACDLAPTESRYFHQRAMVHLNLRQIAPALADLDQALKLKPDDIEALTTRAEIHRARHETQAAIADLDTAAQLAAKEADIRLHLAADYDSLDRFDSAIGQYDLWIPAHDGEASMAQALNGRCWARALTGRDLDQALKDCNRALRASPKTAQILDSRGLVHLRLGEFDKAIDDYDAALALDPKIAWSLYGRGLAKWRKGAKAEGEQDLAAAVALQPHLADEARSHGVVGPDGR